MREPSPAPLPEIPGYRLLERLGQGGMGEVFLADDEAVRRRVALKLISPGLAAGTAEARNRFRREARTMAQVSHPHLAQVYTLGEHAGSDYLALELLEGGSLADRIRKSGPLAEADALAILRQAAEGLAAAWEHGIVHRDVKPANILFDRGGSVKVADFGLAKAVRGKAGLHLTESGVILGSPFYMSPEQIEGRELTCTSDIYSLGIVLFEMLTGKPPSEGESYFSVLNRHREGTLPDLAAALPRVSPAVVEQYRTMTRRNPAERPQSYGDLLAAIDRLPRSVSGASGSSGRRHGRRWAVAGAVLAAAGLAGLVAIKARPSDSVPSIPDGTPVPSAQPVSPGPPAPSPPAIASPPPRVELPETARELAALQTGVFGLRLELASGAPPQLSARTGRAAHLLLFTLDGAGDLLLLYPQGPTEGDLFSPERPLLAFPPPDGPPPVWAFLAATAHPLRPPILLGAKPHPEGLGVVYPHRVEGRTAAFPARDFLRWLAAASGESVAARDLTALPLAAPASSERRNP